MNYFWNMPNITDMKIPEGANTTSTTKVNDLIDLNSEWIFRKEGDREKKRDFAISIAVKLIINH